MATSEEPIEFQPRSRVALSPDCLKDLVNLPMASKWRSLGLQLGVPEHQLDTIQADHQHSPSHTQECLTAMFSWWLKNSSDPTYERLVQALDAIGERDVAEKICKKHGIPIEEFLPRTQPQSPKRGGLGAVGISIGIVVAAMALLYALMGFKAKGYSDTLPYLVGPFVGRENATREILQLLGSSVQVVSIVGPPGFGKSTLSIHVGHELLEQGVDVHYVEMDDVSTVEELAVTILDQQQLVPSDIVRARQKLQKWAKELSTNVKVHVLILDNCDKILHNQKEEFQNTVKHMLFHSTIRILMTSRKVARFLNSFKDLRLNTLPLSDAMKLIDGATAEVNSSVAKNICELVDNTPLALKIVRALLIQKQDACSLKCVVSALQTDPIEALSPSEFPERDTVNPVINLSYNYLASNIQKCARFLANFTGSFDETAAEAILPENLQKNATKCLKILVDHSLLQDYCTPKVIFRYHFHKLIRDFFSKKRKDMGREGEEEMMEFSSKFREYYCGLLRSDSTEKLLNVLTSELHNINQLLLFVLRLSHCINTPPDAAGGAFAMCELNLTSCPSSSSENVEFINAILYFVDRVTPHYTITDEQEAIDIIERYSNCTWGCACDQDGWTYCELVTEFDSPISRSTPNNYQTKCPFPNDPLFETILKRQRFVTKAHSAAIGNSRALNAATSFFYELFLCCFCHQVAFKQPCDRIWEYWLKGPLLDIVNQKCKHKNHQCNNSVINGLQFYGHLQFEKAINHLRMAIEEQFKHGDCALQKIVASMALYSIHVEMNATHKVKDFITRNLKVLELDDVTYCPAYSSTYVYFVRSFYKELGEEMVHRLEHGMAQSSKRSPAYCNVEILSFMCKILLRSYQIDQYDQR